MSATELRSMSISELEALLAERQDEHFRLRMQHHTGQLEKVSRLGQARRSVARIKTILNERQNEVAQ